MKVHQFSPAEGVYDLHSVPLVVSPAIARLASGVVRLAAGTRSPAEGMRMSAEHELAYVISGRLRVETSLGQYDVQAGDMLTLSPAQVHSTTALTDSELFFVLLNPPESVAG